MSGMTKRTTVEAQIGDINLGNINIRDGRGNAFLQDVDPDPTLGPAIDSAYVQDPTLHAAVGTLAAGIDGGAPVPIAANTITTLSGNPAVALVKGLVIQAMRLNVGPIAVGYTNTVDPTAGTQVGIQLQPGESVPIPANSTDGIWVRSTNAADRITWAGG